MVETTTTNPVPTNVKDLYAELEKKAMVGVNRGQKADTIRVAVEKIAAQVGKKKLAVSALFQLVKAQFGESMKLDNSYFRNVLQKTWKIEKDDKDVAWVLLDQPISKN